MHGIDSTVQEHDVNELILVADMKRTGSITFLDLQRLCRQYGDFPSIFTHISGAPSDGKERSDSTSLGEITDHEAKAHSNKLASILAWEGESRFGVATIDRKGRLVNRNLCTMEKSGTPSKPKSYLEGGHVLSWVDAESSMSTNAFRSPTKYQLDHLVSLGSAAVPESLSTTLTTQKFKEACESDPYVRSHGVQLVFKDTVLEFICESKEHCDMLLHGLPIMLNKTHIALVKPKEGAPVPKTAEETTTEAHDMAMSAIKDDDAKLLAKALDKGLDVNTITEGAKSLYDMAIEKNHQNCIELLRKRGAKLAEDMIGETEGDEEAKSNRPPVETLVRDALTLIDKQANARAHTFGRCSHVYMALSENRISVNKRVVEFRQGTSEITRDFELVLDEVAELINQSQNVFKEWRIPPVKVWIEGHTNGALNRDEVWHVHTSSERARNVVSELSKRNVNTDYLFAKGFGCEKPIYDTSGTLAPLNSRVDFVFQIPDSWMRLLPVRMDDAERQGVAGLSAESNGEAKDWKEADATQLMLEGRAGDIDEGGSLAVQFESICPNLCLYQTASTKAAGGMGSFSKGFYVLGAPNTDISTPIQTAGGVASLDTDVPPDSKIPWAIKYVAANKRIQQFFGNYVPVRSGQVIKMSMWIKCIDTVPAPSPKFGFAHSHPPGCDNAWLSQLEPNEWKHVTTSYEADETGLDFLMLQLDGVPNETELLFADLQYVVKDVLSIELEPTPKESQQRGASNTSVGKLANKRVRVVGTSQADLNDSAGVALSYDAQKGRYIVKLRNGRQLALKEQNLVAL
jgi:outer membrane protein OmpA-like peptidoglycan-associated protein